VSGHKKNQRRVCRKILYTRLGGAQVIESGVIVNIITPWLCASPAGIVVRHEVPIKVLEFLCPVGRYLPIPKLVGTPIV